MRMPWPPISPIVPPMVTPQVCWQKVFSAFGSKPGVSITVTESERSRGSRMLNSIAPPSAQTARAGAHRAGQQRMAPMRGLKPPRRAGCRVPAEKAVKQVFGRRAAIFLVVLGALAEGPVPVERDQIGALVGGHRPCSGGDKGKPRRGHQALFARLSRSGRRPRHPSRRERQPSEAIVSTMKQCRVSGRVDRAPQRRNVVDHARSRVDLHHQHRLDCAGRVRGKPRRHRPADRPSGASRRQAPRPPRPSFAAISPQPRAKRPESSTSTVSPRDSVLGKRRLPGAMPVGGIDERHSFGCRTPSSGRPGRCR